MRRESKLPKIAVALGLLLTFSGVGSGFWALHQEAPSLFRTVFLSNWLIQLGVPVLLFAIIWIAIIRYKSK